MFMVCYKIFMYFQPLSNYNVQSACGKWHLRGKYPEICCCYATQVLVRKYTSGLAVNKFWKFLRNSSCELRTLLTTFPCYPPNAYVS